MHQKGDTVVLHQEGRAVMGAVRGERYGAGVQKEYLVAAGGRDAWIPAETLEAYRPRPIYSRFQRHDLVKVYRGAGLVKARIVHVSATDYLVHYQGHSVDDDEWVPHYRVLEDKDFEIDPIRRRRPESDLHVQQLQIENKRLKDELAKTQALLAAAQKESAWVDECSQLQQKCLLVSDHCKKAVERVHGVLEEKQKVIDSWNCVVCLENQINCALVPCGHTFCLGCAVQLDKCPICRQTSVSPLPIFRP
ncbi:hypothetical protein ACHHYP_20786 [Achlya hypogyna]|uniref:RING-type domain-containing protein n=1 Tax=Achlya hypogyna TaxID=1202772 RepID=A0A1V9YA27_ACHHY|nr:hypothetical protein ACHHYP_20786 [Achlya hypogyna]